MREAAGKFYEDWKKKKAAQRQKKLKRQGLKMKARKSWRQRDLEKKSKEEEPKTG